LKNYLQTLHSNTFTTKSTPFKALGSACGTGPNTCPCSYGYCDQSSNTCIAPQVVSVGGQCNSDYDACNLGTCITYNVTTSYGTCQAIRPFQCSCSYNSSLPGSFGGFSNDNTCYSGYCASNGLCDYPRGAGLACSYNFQCYSNNCANGVCTNNVNYGGACPNASYVCPYDAYCDQGTSKCIQYAGVGDQCDQVGGPSTQCNQVTYCDTVEKTCKNKYSLSIGDTCNGGGCPSSGYCNMTGNTGICASYASLVGTPCGPNGCTGEGLVTCGCSSGSPSCQPQIGINCDSQNQALQTCITANCLYPVLSQFPFDSSQCMSQKCGNQFAASFCCEYNGAGNAVDLALNSPALQYFNCKSNTITTPSCNPNSSTSLIATAYTIVIAILFNLLF